MKYKLNAINKILSLIFAKLVYKNNGNFDIYIVKNGAFILIYPNESSLRHAIESTIDHAPSNFNHEYLIGILDSCFMIAGIKRNDNQNNNYCFPY